jgi:hypothetical protein
MADLLNRVQRHVDHNGDQAILIPATLVGVAQQLASELTAPSPAASTLLDLNRKSLQAGRGSTCGCAKE